MTMPTTPIEADLPLYFGADAELFGLYQPADASAGKAVLLCPPLGQEQIRCHRLYRQLAHALAAEGIAVLRFDYYGCGDSAGASDEVDWQRCLTDTAMPPTNCAGAAGPIGSSRSVPASVAASRLRRPRRPLQRTGRVGSGA